MGKMKELAIEEEWKSMVDKNDDILKAYQAAYNVKLPKPKNVISMRKCTCGTTSVLGEVDLSFHSHYCDLKRI